MIVINGKTNDHIHVTDRGLQYGDGVFETIAYRHGKLEFLTEHLQRLFNGCESLAIAFEQQTELQAELEALCLQLGAEQAVVKVIITRGEGSRGYYSDNSALPTRIISTHSYPEFPTHYQSKGVTLRFCQQMISSNSRLAGVKHLNRLEQVLARSEWHDPDIAEGIMLDVNGHIIEGTMSNLFIVESDTLSTPLLSESGVAGVLRSKVMQLAKNCCIPVREEHISKESLAAAEEVFICNSLIGIWPVTRIADETYAPGFLTQCLQKALLKSDK